MVMFRRLLLHESVNDLTLVVFLLFFVVFIAAVIWALRLPPERVRHLEELPLEPSANPLIHDARQD